MGPLTRRSFLRAAASSAAALGLPSCRQRSGGSPPRASTGAARVHDLAYSFEDFLYRTPIKFGGTEVDRVTLLDVHCTLRGPGGRESRGFGSMPLGNVWSFPSRTLSYAATLGAMKTLAARVRDILAGHPEPGHPIDITLSVEAEYHKAAAEVSRALKLDVPVPKLCALVTASPFDAALHDAYGKLHQKSSYHTYGPDHLPRDLGHYLGPEFKGETLERYVLREPKPRMPLYHLVGAVDPIEAEDVKLRVGDGLPETLPEWIERDGLTHIKIKLNGDDLKWDVDRVVRVERAAARTQGRRGQDRWHYSLDFNERCKDVGYLLEFLRRLKAEAPAGFARIQYVEQPTARDLRQNRHNVMHEAAKVLPVVIDESFDDPRSLHLAREMGYSGAALKACKGQTQSLLMAAMVQKHRLFLCVQDLTCPGASLIHSAGLAAHIPAAAAIEANSRQYVPAANRGWEGRFPGIFRPRDGALETGVLTGMGLGAV